MLLFEINPSKARSITNIAALINELFHIAKTLFKLKYDQD